MIIKYLCDLKLKIENYLLYSTDAAQIADS